MVAMSRSSVETRFRVSLLLTNGFDDVFYCTELSAQLCHRPVHIYRKYIYKYALKEID